MCLTFANAAVNTILKPVLCGNHSTREECSGTISRSLTGFVVCSPRVLLILLVNDDPCVSTVLAFLRVSPVHLFSVVRPVHPEHNDQLRVHVLQNQLT